MVRYILFVGTCVMLIIGITCGGLIYLGVKTPEDRVLPGDEVPERFLTQILALDLLEEQEAIRFFYSDAFLDIEEGFYFVTDERLVVYINEWEEPCWAARFDEIDDFSKEQGEFGDYTFTVVRTDGEEVWFPLSENDSHLFINFVDEGVRAVRQKGIDENADIERLELLEASGSDVTKLHEFTFSGMFENEETARRAARDIENREFSIEVQLSEGGGSWRLDATRKMVPILEEVRAVRETFSSVCKQRAGEFKSWSASPID